jgi:hypothetical protein
MLDTLLNTFPFWRDLPYTTKGTVIRAIRAGLAVTISILLTAALQGLLFPPDWSPLVVIALTTLLQAIDKYLREKSIEREAGLLITDSASTDLPTE